MKYTIKWIENKPTSTGKARAIATLTNEQGQDITDVSLWGTNWPNLQTLMVGAVIDGDLVEKQNGQYLNRALYPLKSAPQQAANRSFSPNRGGMAAAQERKSEYIKEAQDRKEISIAYFNAVNNAVNIIGHYAPDSWPSREDYQIELRKWIDWLLDSWRTWEAKPIEDKKQPF